MTTTSDIAALKLDCDTSAGRYTEILIAMNLTAPLEFARSFVLEVRKLVLDLWEDDDLQVELKQDRSPVTKLDRAIELNFRDAVHIRFPTHSIAGEEYGFTGGDTEFIWVIDPIDGTQSLVNRVPTFGTVLALLHNFEPVLGLIDIPVLERSISGAVGLGVTDERGRCIEYRSNHPYSANEIVALSSSATFARGGQQEIQAKLQHAFPTCRTYCDCFGHYLVASGAIGGLIEMNVPLWDIAATEALVKAAGGEVLVLERNLDLMSPRSSVCGRKAVVSEIQRIMLAT